MPAPKYSIEQQEQLILAAAANCIQASSLLDFKMSDIAKGAGLSMGSVYKHIQSKEDLLVALAAQMSSQIHQVFKTILELPFSPGAKLVSLQMLNPSALYSHEFASQLFTLVANAPVLNRVSLRWRDELVQANERITGLFVRMLQEAIEQQQLLSRADVMESLIEEIILGHWSMNVGFIQVAQQQHACEKALNSCLPFPLGISHPIVQSSLKLVNAYPWQQPVREIELKHLSKQLDQLGYL